MEEINCDMSELNHQAILEMHERAAMNVKLLIKQLEQQGCKASFIHMNQATADRIGVKMGDVFEGLKVCIDNRAPGWNVYVRS